MLNSSNITNTSLTQLFSAISKNLSNQTISLENADLAGRDAGKIHLNYYYDYITNKFNSSSNNNNSNSSSLNSSNSSNSSSNSTSNSSSNSSGNSTNSSGSITRRRLLQKRGSAQVASADGIKADKLSRLFLVGYLYEIVENVEYYGKYWSRELLKHVSADKFNVSKFSADNAAIASTNFELEKAAFANIFEVKFKKDYINNWLKKQKIFFADY